MLRFPRRSARSNSHARLRTRNLMGGMEPLEDRRVLAAFTVTTLSDVVNSKDGVLSLREAVQKTNASVDLQNTIQFAPALDGGVVSLTRGELAIAQNVTLETAGPGRVTINGMNASRLFNVRPFKSLAIDSVDLKQGRSTSGGAIYVRSGGQLTLTNATLQANSATSTGGAIYGEVNTTLNATHVNFLANTASSHGGAIRMASSTSVTLHDSYFANNVADSDSLNGGDGGAVYSGGAVGIADTEFTANQAKSGGAIYGATGSVVTVSDGEFEGNRAVASGGAIVSYLGTLNLTGSHVEENTAGYRGGAVYLYNSAAVITSNSRFNENSAVSEGGAIYATGGNVNIAAATFDENSANAGGGAIRVTNATNLTIQLSLFAHQSAKGDGGAIRASASTVNLVDTEFRENSIVRVPGLTSGGRGGAIYAYGGALSTNGSSFLRNQSFADGGAIFVDVSTSEVAVRTATFDGNIAGDDGGAIAANNNDLLVENSTFRNNSAAANRGGALYLYGRTANLSNVLFESNRSQNDGGAVFADRLTQLSFQACTFWANSSGDDGGGLFGATSTISISNCLFQNNVAADDGGAAYFKPLVVATITNTNFQANTAEDTAGAVFIRESSVHFVGGTFSGNLARHLHGTGSPSDGIDGLLSYDSSAIAHASVRFTSTTVGGVVIVETTLATSLTSAQRNAIFAAYPILATWL